MAPRDFYNVLGIDRNASTEEVKRAYRVLARQWHPDRNAGDPEAERRFKDLTEAYRTLSDPEKRERYNRLGPLYTEDGRPPKPEDVSQVVSGLWSNLFGRRQESPGEDLRFTLSLTLEEVARGGDKEFVVPRFITCNACGGLGAPPEQRPTCSVCKGSGKSTGPRLLRSSCYHCDGRGWVPSAPCARCTGEGRVLVEDPLRCKVPAGVAAGQKLKLSGKGNVGRGGQPAGDLYVLVNLQEHPYFTRRGEDVLCDLPLLFAEMTLGAEVRVPTLEGPTTIRVPPGTPPGRTLRLAGRGLGAPGRSGRGDLLYQVVLDLPTDLLPAQRDLLMSFHRSLGPAQHPTRRSFDEALPGETPPIAPGA